MHINQIYFFTFLFILFLFFTLGCSGVKVKKLAKQQYQINSYKTTLFKDADTIVHSWEKKAKSLCPNGYKIISQKFVEDFDKNDNELIGTIECNDQNPKKTNNN